MEVFDAHARLFRRGDYLWGSFVKPERIDGYIVGTNPGDRSDSLGRFAFARESVDDAMVSARRGYRTWARSTLKIRGAVLRRFARILGESQERMANLLTRETGKPLWEARQEVTATIRTLELLLEDGVGLLAPRVVNQREARSDWRPHGVVAVVTPYQFPLLLPTMFCLSSILAGNAVVFKPSKFTPGVGQGIAEIMDRSQLPRGVFNLVQGSGAVVGQYLVTQPQVDALVMAGSYKSAQAIRRSIVGRPELPAMVMAGGKGCALVLDETELDRAVYDVVVGAFLTTGQRHNSCARAIVHEAVFDTFCARVVARASQLAVGYGVDPDMFMGPLISTNHRNRFRQFGRDVAKTGHTMLLEGLPKKVAGRKGCYVTPAVFQIDWRHRKPFVDVEPPGPTLLLYSVASWAEALALHNRLAFRHTTSVFADQNEPVLEELLDGLDTGALHVNRATIGSSLRLPAAGRGYSSNAYPTGIELLRFLASPRATLVDHRPFDPSRLVPGVNW